MNMNINILKKQTHKVPPTLDTMHFAHTRKLIIQVA